MYIRLLAGEIGAVFNVNSLPWTGQNREEQCTSGFWLEKLVQFNVNCLPWTGQNREEQCTSGF